MINGPWVRIAEPSGVTSKGLLINLIGHAFLLFSNQAPIIKALNSVIDRRNIIRDAETDKLHGAF